MKKLIIILSMALTIFSVSCLNTEPTTKEYELDKEYVLTIPQDSLIIKQPISYAFHEAVYEPGDDAQVNTFMNKDIRTITDPATDFFYPNATVSGLKISFVAAFNNLKVVKDGISEHIDKNDVIVIVLDENQDIITPINGTSINSLLDKAGKSITFILPPLEFKDDLTGTATDTPQVLGYMIVVTQ